MGTYVGWVPTAIGRLSFTRIGDSYEAKCAISNTCADDSYQGLFGVKRRRERLWWLEWLTRWWGDHRTTDLAFFLNASAADLPFSRDSTAADPDRMYLAEAEDGCLEGPVYFLREWNFWRGRPAFAALDTVRDAVFATERLRGRGDSALEVRHRAQRRVEAAWRFMQRQNRKIESTPDFGRAYVKLLRTGECRITLDIEDQGVWQELQSYGIVAWWPDEKRELAEAEILDDHASRIFLCIRDLVHKHYHHEPGEFVDGWVTRVTPTTDHTWRKRSLEALMRMCVSLRRKESAAAYRKALGVIAYADSFQRHMARWHVRGKTLVRTRGRTDYDFTALKASIDASLKARELRDQNLRARMFFAFGTLLTALTIILPTYRERLKAVQTGADLSAYSDGIGAQIFTAALGHVLAHPLSSSMVAIGLGFAIDYAFVSLSAGRPLHHWSAFSNRLVERALSLARGVTPGSRGAKILVVVVTALGVCAMALIWVQIFREVGIAVHDDLGRWLPFIE